MDRAVVFLCRCFGSIDRIIDFGFLEKRLILDPAVSSTVVVDSLCLDDSIKKAASLIKAGDADKVLIAACSSLARGDQLIADLEKEGVERSRVHLVDIREGCAWIHGDRSEEASRKADNLIHMGLASLRHKGKSDDVSVKISPEALIIGAGPAGLASATSLAGAGFTVHVLERSAGAGGMLRLVARAYPGDSDPSEKLKPYFEALENNSSITFYPRAKLSSVTGYAGSFKVRFTSDGKDHYIRPGAIIVATGSRMLLPHGLYDYGETKNVITQMELETRFKKGPVETGSAVFIQCVGARCSERPYCSTICCPTSIKNAMRLCEKNPRAGVFILHRDVMTPGSVLEAYYRRALSEGIQFIRFDENNPPSIRGEDHVEAVEVYDTLTGITRTIPADLAVLSTPLIPNDDNGKLAEMLGIGLDRSGFFREIYPLHPLETRMEGIYICGSARWPVASEQAIALLKKGEVAASSFSRVPGLKFGHARVNEASCTGCGDCVAVCPFEACRLQRVDGKYPYVSRVNKMRCRACGSCVSVCPNGSMQVPEYHYRSVCGMIEKAY
jgi:heterodisulfide reductase subunit A